MNAADCTATYVFDLPTSTPFVPSLPPDIPPAPHVEVLASTGFDGTVMLLCVIGVVVVVFGLVLIVAGRRSR